MPNDYFSFKKFRIYQDKTSMKVGTDGVLLGAYVNSADAGKALDIGTGTGLIALMLAQKTENTVIDAIEIDEQAFNQAKENVHDSPWNSRITIHHISFQDFVRSIDVKYDLIVSNPPFFSSSVLPADKGRLNARHDMFLNIDDLIDGVNDLLNLNGRFYVINPLDGFNKIIVKARKKGLYCNELLTVKPFKHKPVNRVIAMFERTSNVLEQNTLILYNDLNVFSSEYMNLTKDYYLNF